MLPLLQALSSREEKRTKTLIQELSDVFELTHEERNQFFSSGSQRVMENRVGWARTYLKKAGLIESPKRGILTISERGLEVLSENLKEINAAYLKRFDEFRAFYRLSNTNVVNHNHHLQTNNQASQIIENDETPIERLEQASKQLNDEVRAELLDKILALSPEFFETLVVDLMLAMGYGGSRKDAGQATQYTQDGGIDGIIKEDKLGLDMIYLQAKRYTNTKVGRPDIQAFAGALDMHRAKKGVFITTSSFSKEANDYIGLIEKRIVLIDGEQLTELMLAHNLGVSTKQVFDIKTLDSDYFLED